MAARNNAALELTYEFSSSRSSYKNIFDKHPVDTIRGCNGPVFHRAVSGGANANGPVFLPESTDSASTRPQSAQPTAPRAAPRSLPNRPFGERLAVYSAAASTLPPARYPDAIAAAATRRPTTTAQLTGGWRNQANVPR